jgi:hypothetical protein
MVAGISTIIDAMARTLWVTHWGDEHERKCEEDSEHELPWGGGDDLMDVAPETPWQAYVDAGRLVGMVEARNRLQIDAAWASALKRDGVNWEELDEAATRKSKEDFGHYLTMEALGHGVSWMDDHEEHGLEVPHFEPGYLPEVFSGVRCDVCFKDAGADWVNCDGCKRPTCQECLLPSKRGPICSSCDAP